MNRQALFLVPFFFALLACGGNDQSGQGGSDEATSEVTATRKQVADTPLGRSPESKLAYIEQYIGQRPAAFNLWGTEPLRTMLMDLLGNDSDLYLLVMQEAMPLRKDQVVYTVGVAPDDHVPGVGYLLVDTKNDKIRAFAIFGDAEIDVRSPGTSLPVPGPVQQKVREVLGR